VALPIHTQYDIAVPALPVIRVEEALAEKLARYRRVSLARDLYDLQWFATQGSLDAALVRRLWVLKVYRDVVDDGRGTKPLDPQQILRPRTGRDFTTEDIGYLTQPVRFDDWIQTVRTRYAFLADLTVEEARWCECNPRDSYEVTAALRSLL
jgi:predicted nucleotidyltransferase component of viral defense system